LIVGGGTGIGLAVAGRLLERGMSVGISGRRDSVLRQAREELSKAAVSSLARSLCIDLAPRGIQVNAVAPGWVHTSMVDEFVRSATAEALGRINPLGRVGKPDEVANLIEYLGLDAPDYLTGSTIFIDGGQTAMAPLI
jgi:NAD(P)-dependent dehydrogenase (short-subunit alcohol dehydrogenase family)